MGFSSEPASHADILEISETLCSGPVLLVSEICFHQIPATGLKAQPSRKPDRAEPTFTSTWPRSSQLLQRFPGRQPARGPVPARWGLGNVCFHGPPASLNGPCEAPGVVGALCTRVVPAKNICTQSSAVERNTCMVLLGWDPGLLTPRAQKLQPPPASPPSSFPTC